tara:strand:- start:205 stop:708 length:504 start_codon:yes stop_codon:yes gene_type:complete
MADRKIEKAPAEFHNTIKMTEANSALTYKKQVDNATLNTGSGVTHTLTAAESGTHFNIDGTGNIVVNMPALSTNNVGLHYSFLVTTAVGGGTTVTFVLPGSAVSNFFAERVQYTTASYPRVAVSGDTLTLGSSSAVGSRVELTCIADDGTNSTWMAYIASNIEPTLG